MSNALLADWRIFDEAVRVVLIRVLPGREMDVGREIQNRYERLGISKSRFRIYRLFGNFDLAFLQDGCSLQHSDFVRIGSIPFITSTSEFICYKWARTSDGQVQKSFDMSFLNTPLIALLFLKINPLLTQEFGVLPELNFARFLKNKSSLGPSVQMLNTLGWVEALLTVTDDDLTGLLKRVSDQLPHFTYRMKDEYFADKTLTLIGHMLDVCALGKAQREVKLSPKGKVGNKIGVDLSVACKPKAMGKIERSAKNILGLNESVGLRFGPTDLHFQMPIEDIDTINELRNRLDRFKADNASQIIRTHTEIQFNEHEPWQESTTNEQIATWIEITLAEAEGLANLGTDGEAVAAAVYQFSNLTQTGLIVDAFSDLMNAFSVLKNRSVILCPPVALDLRGQLAGRLRWLEAATSQRMLNIYLGLEESPFATYLSGVGIQRVFKGLEAYAARVLMRLERTWDGFVCLGDISARFEHYIDAVIIPPDAALRASSHWAISHELMHVYQNLSAESLSLKKIQRFSRSGETEKLETIDPSSDIWNILAESLTDVLDYSLCCPLSLDDYLEVVWQHLDGQVIGQHAVTQCAGYLYRSFAVICYDQFVHGEIVDDALFDNRCTSKVLRKYIKKIDRHCSLAKLYKKDTCGQEYLQVFVDRFITELIFYMPWIYRQAGELVKKGVSARKLSKLRLRQIVGRLQDGYLVSSDDLKYPDAVAWTLRVSLKGKDEETINRTTVAWLLSLWNTYQTQTIGPDLRKCVVKDGV